MRKDHADPPRPAWHELLADPIVWTVMEADGVVEAELRRLLEQAGERLAGGSVEAARTAAHAAPALEEGQYRPGVGIMLVNDRGDVLVGRRVDVPEEAWQMPQGGIGTDETPLAAAFRELREEIGTDKALVLAESRGWLHYDLPPGLADRRWGGRWRGQRQKWFVMRFLGRDEEINVATEHPEFSAWRWAEPGELPTLIVGFKQQLYRDVLSELHPVAKLRHNPGI